MGISQSMMLAKVHQKAIEEIKQASAMLLLINNLLDQQRFNNCNKKISLTSLLIFSSQVLFLSTAHFEVFANNE